MVRVRSLGRFDGLGPLSWIRRFHWLIGPRIEDERPS